MAAKPNSVRWTLNSITAKHIRETIRPGDCVLVRSVSSPKESYVARVENIEPDSRGVKLHVRWFLRPEQSIAGRKKFHGSKELFLSDHFDYQSADSIVGTCKVHSINNYTKLDAVGTKDFFCRFEYNSTTGAFSPDTVSVFCKCEMPYNPDDLTIQCDGCSDWFHPACIDMTPEDAQALEHFYCHNCSPEELEKLNNSHVSTRQADMKKLHFHQSKGPEIVDRQCKSPEKVYQICKNPAKADQQRKSPTKVDPRIADNNELEKDKGEYVGTDDDDDDDDINLEENGETFNTDSDGLEDIWNEMAVHLQCLKDPAEDVQHDEHKAGNEQNCDHLFTHKDDIGDVCRICGFISRRIEDVIEYNFSKDSRSTRTYKYERRTTTRELDLADNSAKRFKLASDVFDAAELHPHPRHGKVMKPHQVEGFKFLLSNLVSDCPGGCIMAHAPGSGKTFMIICFLQSFMAKYPAARPLVVLPKGILDVWKKEFKRWQIEEIPLYDFYSVKAKSRAQQLNILKQWEKERSILFLGYTQFSTILCDTGGGKEAAACQTYLSEVPTVLILDEGHTPRNKDTDIMTSLQRVETPRKVVLSGTLYQNHVKEVFNILNLVRPRFLNMETPKLMKSRILGRVQISGSKNANLTDVSDNMFYDLIEHTLTKDENHERKRYVIHDLREMTRNVLHFYKGDNLDELPGLVDFSVFLRLSPNQTNQVKKLQNLNLMKFKSASLSSAIYVHPVLKTLMENSEAKERVEHKKIDALLEKNFDVSVGVKASFYLNLLNFCESSGEKLLVFSQYLPPLKFLERMIAKLKGYTLEQEMFMITGDSVAEKREFSVEKFNSSSKARVFFGSIKACGEGISLVGASRIIILDVHPNPSVTRQAIGRAFRPGQVKKVYTYRLIASESPEENDLATCYIKDSIAKQWFESDRLMRQKELDMDKVDMAECGDVFLETARLSEVVSALFKW